MYSGYIRSASKEYMDEVEEEKITDCDTLKYKEFKMRLEIFMFM